MNNLAGRGGGRGGAGKSTILMIDIKSSIKGSSLTFCHNECEHIH